MTANRKYSDRILAIETELNEVNDQLKTLRAKQRRLQEEKRRLEVTVESRANAVGGDEEWEQKEFPWSGKLAKIRKDRFKMEKFRELQLATMNAILSGEDVILVMSTGGGKSLCYQLPALYLEGITLVISPLVSLMEDQIMSMDKLLGVGIAAKLSQSSTKEEVARVQNEMTDPKANKLRLLYVTPEKLAKSKRFMAKLEKCYELGRLKLIAIDEVHCCSQWGHDFRPDYKFLNVLRRQFRKVPLLGLTATATASVLDDVKEMLGIQAALTFRATFNRPNLFYEVRWKPQEKEKMMTELGRIITSEFAHQSGIVYCFSRKESEDLSDSLRSQGIKSAWYHADMDPMRRSEVHEKWISNHYQVIVATVAFGMGIDKPDVRFVIHHSMPKSMENYYQESGRAGRDGESARCIVYFRLADLFRQSTMVSTEKTGLQNLYPMLGYCLSAGACRRSLIAESFMENWDESWCSGKCDICAKELRVHGTEDVTSAAREMSEIAKSATQKQQKVTGAKLLELWLKTNKKTSKENAEKILGRLLIDEYLKEDFHFTPYSIISYVVPGTKAGLLNLADHRLSISLAEKETSKRKSEASRVGEVKKPKTEENIKKPLKTEQDVVVLD